MDEVLTLTLGDILPAIPTDNIRAGLYDEQRELRFSAKDIAADHVHGRATIPLPLVIAQCPDIFHAVADASTGVVRVALAKLHRAAVADSANEVPASAPGPPVTSTSEAAAPAASATPSDEMIQLSLAAVIKRCPREIVTQDLPPIDPSIKISLPFAPIARQLPTGRVEVSSRCFISALPAELVKGFEPRDDVKVPLPLQEIFQNLPAHRPRVVVNVPRRSAALSDSFGDAELPHFARSVERVAPEISERPFLSERPENGAAQPAVVGGDSAIASGEIQPAALTQPDANLSSATANGERQSGEAQMMAPESSTPDLEQNIEDFPVTASPSVSADEVAPVAEVVISTAQQAADEASFDTGAAASNVEQLLPLAADSNHASDAMVPPITPPLIIPRITPPPAVVVAPPESKRVELGRADHDAATDLHGFLHPQPAPVDYAQAAQKVVELPGVQGCILFAPKETISIGTFPWQVAPSTLRQLSDRTAHHIEELGLNIRVPILQFTMHDGAASVTFFTSATTPLCVVSHDRDLLPFVRERIAAAVAKLKTSSP